MQDDGAADDAVRRISADRQAFEHHVDLRSAEIVEHEVSHVAGVSRRRRSAVLRFRRVEVAAGAHRVTRAAVALLMNVKPLLAGMVAADPPGDAHAVRTDLSKLDL